MNIDPQSDFHGFLAIATPIAVILAAVIQKLDARKVRRDLDKSSVKRDAKLEEIHSLVNGNMGEALRLAMLHTERIAQLTRDLPGGERDQQIADEAARKYLEHMDRIARVDIAAAQQRQKPI